MRRFHLCKRLLLVSLVLFTCVLPVQAYSILDYYRCTREVPLVQALSFLEQSSTSDALAFMMDNRVKVLFKDMRELGKTYRNHDALSIITNDDRLVVYINVKHYSAPPQALAALISHEVMHNDRENSIKEEIAAWSREAGVWQEMLGRYPELKQIAPNTVPLVDRLNAISLMVERNMLDQEIKNNVSYKNLPESSPGF